MFAKGRESVIKSYIIFSNSQNKQMTDTQHNQSTISSPTQSTVRLTSLVPILSRSYIASVEQSGNMSNIS